MIKLFKLLISRLGGIALSFILFVSCANAAPLTDSELIRGFNLTVFGAEFSSYGGESRHIRKFSRTVKFRIHNNSKVNRTTAAKRFIRSLNSKIHGLKARIARSNESANFNLYIVDRKDYADVVRAKVYRNSRASVPGRCIVRSVFNFSGILRSDAVVVSDEGEALFNRCLVEETLQGLGVLNEHSSLSKSVFNDQTKHISFTKFDRHIMNMLYDPRVKNGAPPLKVNAVLPAVLKDVRKRLR